MKTIREILVKHYCVMNNITDECGGCGCFDAPVQVDNHEEHVEHLLVLIVASMSEALFPDDEWGYGRTLEPCEQTGDGEGASPMSPPQSGTAT